MEIESLEMWVLGHVACAAVTNKETLFYTRGMVMSSVLHRHACTYIHIYISHSFLSLTHIHKILNYQGRLMHGECGGG